MTFHRRLLIEDRADRINHVWYFLLLLLLSLAAWLLAAILSLYPVIPQNDPRTHTRVEKVKYTTKCFCPGNFTVSMVEYSQSSCSASFEKTMDNVEPKVNYTAVDYAKLYFPKRMPITSTFLLKKFSRSKTTDIGIRSVSQEIHDLLERTAVVLFSLALALKLTHILWVIYLSCLAQSLFYFLDSFQTGLRQDEASKEEYIQEFINNITQTTKPSSLSTSLFYLFIKLLQTAIAISGAVVIRILLQTSAEISRDELETFENAYYHGFVLICETVLLVGGSISTYLIQCAFTADSVLNPADYTYFTDTTDEERLVIVLYESVTKIVYLLLLILSIHNIYIFVVWFFKLMPGYCRRKIVPGPKLPMYGYFLVNMVMENVGYMEALQIKAAIPIIVEKSETQEANDGEIITTSHII